jgi:hypothetical protein
VSLPTTLQLKRAAMADQNLTQKATPICIRVFGKFQKAADRSFATNGANFFQEYKSLLTSI